MNSIKKIFNFFLVAFLFLLPFPTVWLLGEASGSQYLRTGIYATEILLWLALVFGFLVWMNETKVAVKKRGEWLMVALLALVAWSGISIIWAGNKQVGFFTWLHLVEAIGLLVLVWKLRISPKMMAWPLAAAGTAQAVLAVWQFFTQQVIANKWLGMAAHSSFALGDGVVENASGRWLRAYGSFSHPNALGGFLVLAIFCCIWLYLNSSKPWQRLSAWSGLLIASAGLFFTFSRSAWLGLGIGLMISLIIVAIREKDFLKPLIKSVAGVLLVMVALTIISQPMVMSRVSIDGRLEDISISQRQQYLSQAGEVISGHWLSGVGMGNYIPALQSLDSGHPDWYYQPVHNIYVLVSAELGIVGLLVFISLCSCVLVMAWRRGNYIILGLFIAFLVIGFFDHYLWTLWPGVLMWWVSVVLAIGYK